MKAMSKRRQAAELYGTGMDIMENNLFIALKTLHDDFGFGAERLDKFFLCIMETAQTIDTQIREQTFEVKQGDFKRVYHERFRELLKITTKPYFSPEMWEQCFIVGHNTYTDFDRMDCQKERKLQERAAVSVAEAAEMQEFMRAVQDFAKSGGAIALKDKKIPDVTVGENNIDK